jgi:hypothetical protein
VFAERPVSRIGDPKRRLGKPYGIPSPFGSRASRTWKPFCYLVVKKKIDSSDYSVLLSLPDYTLVNTNKSIDIYVTKGSVLTDCDESAQIHIAF